MGVTNLILLAVSLILQGFLFALLWRQRTYWQFPFFFAYTGYSVCATVVLLATSSHFGAYLFAYWANEALLAVLAVLALHEAFRRVFFGFYARFRWFRLLFPAVVALALLIVLWAALHGPTARSSALRSAVLLFGIAVNFIQALLFCLFIGIARTFRLRWRFAPLGILLGFTISAVGSLVDYWGVSVFGTKVENFLKYVPPVAYILAVVIWLDTFLRPEPGPGVVSAATIRQIAEEIRQDTIAIKKFLEKSK
jgi:hypothetical protein